MNVEKFVRRFQRTLQEHELQARRSSVERVINVLRGDPKWNKWITGAILFGSTARGEAKTGSDVDVAILTEQNFFMGLDYPFITGELKQRIDEIQKELGIKLKINPQIVSEQWLAHPLSSKVTKPEVIATIKEEGIRIY